jgi:phosphate:Na+ symporter
VALKNDYFNMAMYLLAFAGVMMGFFKKEKIKLAGLLCSGLGLIFVGLEVMSSEQAFGNPLVESMFTDIFSVIDFPLLLILVGVIFTALIQSSSASTGVVITMVGAGVLPLDQALFIVLGANIGTCVTALLASVGANANSKRVALIHFTFNVIGTVVFTALIWLFREPAVNFLVSLFPGSDPMSLQMRVSVFHVIFNVTTTCLLIPFVKQLVDYSCLVIKDKKEQKEELSLKFVDDRLLSAPSIALMQAKKEIDYMISLVEENVRLSLASVSGDPAENASKITQNEEVIDFTNGALTRFLIKLSASVDERDEQRIGSYFHVLNDLERIGDHAENFHEIGQEMLAKKISFSDTAMSDIQQMYGVVIEMIAIAMEAFDNENQDRLPALSKLENETDEMKRSFSVKHFSRLSEGNCSLEVSPYYTSTITGLERVADHIVNVGYSICNPVGDDK